MDLTWDRSHKWEIQRTRHDIRRLKIRFAGLSPNPSELLALRKRFPNFRDVVPADLKASICEGELMVGSMAGREAYSLAKAALPSGMELVIEDVSYTSYLPLDVTTGIAWLIENEADSKRVSQEMLAAGAAVPDVEA